MQEVLQGISPASNAYAELEKTLLHMNDVLEQLNPLLNTLNEQPDALIFGSESEADPIPVKGKRR